MLCRDVEDLGRAAVSLVHSINSNVEKWQDDIGRSEPHLSNDVAQTGAEWDALYRRVAIIFEDASRLIRSMEKNEFVVEGKAEFLAAKRELAGIICFTQEDIATGAEQVRQGQTRPLGEIWDELWNQPRH